MFAVRDRHPAPSPAVAVCQGTPKQDAKAPRSGEGRMISDDGAISTIADRQRPNIRRRRVQERDSAGRAIRWPAEMPGRAHSDDRWLGVADGRPRVAHSRTQRGRSAVTQIPTEFRGRSSLPRLVREASNAHAPGLDRLRFRGSRPILPTAQVILLAPRSTCEHPLRPTQPRSGRSGGA